MPVLRIAAVSVSCRKRATHSALQGHLEVTSRPAKSCTESGSSEGRATSLTQHGATLCQGRCDISLFVSGVLSPAPSLKPMRGNYVLGPSRRC